MIALAAATGVVMALLPIRRLRCLAAVDVACGVRGGSNGVVETSLRSAVATAQIALAFVLLIAGGLLLASFREVLRVDPGFQPSKVVTVSINLPGTAYRDTDAVVNVTHRILEQLRALPGVTAAGATNTIPLGGVYSNSVVFGRGAQLRTGESVIAPHRILVTPGYFEAMRIPLVRGREFDARDVRGEAPVALIDQRLAEKLWPGQDPIGRQLYRPADWSNPEAVTPQTTFITVIGVIGNVQLTGLVPRDALLGAYYFALPQIPSRALTFAVRSSQDPAALLAALRRSVHAIDPELPVFDALTMDERLARSLADRRLPMQLALTFALVALFLAAIGVYGVLAYQVVQRRREIGIRVALGSTPGDIFGVVLRDGTRITIAGVAIGFLGALAMTRSIAGLLYRVSSLDPIVIASVTLILITVALMATVIPAFRAAHVDPLAALRE
jgi:putative ABC transport system permease protein